MKTTVKLILAACATIAAVVSCSKDLQVPDSSSEFNGEVRELVFDASLCADTKTSVNPSTGASTWDAEGESVKVANLEGNSADATVTRSATDFSKATINATLAESANYLAVSPASSYAGVMDASGILAKLPSTQDGTLLQYMAATTSSSQMSFAFKNICSVLKFTTGRTDVRKVVFSALGEDVILTGDNLYFNASTGEYLTDYEESFGGVKSVTLDAGALLAKDTDYYLAVVPRTLASGFKLLLYGGEAGDQLLGSAKYTSSFQLKRSTIINLGDVDTQVKNTISNAAELQDFLDNASLFASTAEYSLVNDIDLAGVTITPAEDMKCVLNGANFSIKNWVTEGTPLMKINSGTVKNLKIDSSCTVSTPVAGGDFGCICAKNNGTLDNCTNNADLTINAIPAEQTCCYGGLSGRSYGLLKGCTNNGAFTANTTFASNLYLGGIAGLINRSSASADSFAENCSNSGAISLTTSSGCVKNTYVGGIIGATTANKGEDGKTMKNYGTISECVNSADISIKVSENGSGSYVNLGGVIGYAQGQMINCSNSGDVSIENPYRASAAMTALGVGGLCGRLVFGAQNSSNSGKVSVKGTYVPGTANASGTAASCSPCIGGLFGVCGCNALAGDENVSGCTNSGSYDIDVTMATANKSTGYFGGIVGYANMPVTNCTFENSGYFKASTMFYTSSVGGIAGLTTANAPISGCYFKASYRTDFDISFYTGSDVPELRSAVIVANPKGLVSDCHVTNTASITVNHNYKLYFGAIAGNAALNSAVPSPSISNCSNAADISVNVSYLDKASIKQSWIGGLLGFTENTSINNCENTGNLTVSGNFGGTNFNYAGGIGGSVKAVTNCTSTCNVTSTAAGAMRVGIVAGSSGALTGCTASGTATMTNAIGAATLGTGKQSAIGGLAGHCSSTVKNCSFEGSVINNSAQNTSTGGFVGTIGNASVAHSGCSLKADIQASTATVSNGIWIGGQVDAGTSAKTVTFGAEGAPLEIDSSTKFLGATVTAADLVKEKLIGYLSPTAGTGSGSTVNVTNVVLK